MDSSAAEESQDGAVMKTTQTGVPSRKMRNFGKLTRTTMSETVVAMKIQKIA